MLIVTTQQLRDVLDRRVLVDALAAMFRDGCEAPVRHHHSIATDGPAATLLLMPAWLPGRFVGTKVANVFPGNGARGLPAVQSVYLLFSGETGELLATLEGAELTTRRTVAASSLAVRHLARQDASRLLVIGTGAVARQVAASHAAVRPIRDVTVWGRDPAKAAELAGSLARDGFRASVAADLPEAVATADIVSSATLSREPIVRGQWLRPGTHLDLIGGFTPLMREADDDAMRRASVFIDTEGALKEAGDIAQPLREGVLTRASILADLPDLTRGRHPGRTSDAEITLFKSTGASAEDLAAAILAYTRISTTSADEAAIAGSPTG